MKGQLLVESAAMGYSGTPQRFLDGADRADVHGRPGAADRLRQRREPADRARRSCGRRKSRCACRSARRADGWSASCSSRAWCCRSPAASLGSALAVALTRGAARADPVAGPAAPDHAPTPTCGSSRSRSSLTFATGIVFGLLPALRASRPDPWTTLKDTVGSIAGTRRIAVPAQGARHRAGGAELPAAVRRRPVRAQPAEPQDDRHRRGARQPRHVPAVARPQRLRRRARGASSIGSCSSGFARRPA